MPRRRTPTLFAPWSNSVQRTFDAMTRRAVRAGTQVVARNLQAPAKRRARAAGSGSWVSGVAFAAGGARRWRLYRPPGAAFGEPMPLVVMLHGCGQTAEQFALSTRMNRIAARERFAVLYPEQERSAHPQGCWNWYGTRSGQAQQEASILMAAIDQVCVLYHADARRVAVAGLSAGASMAALLATRHPERFAAVIMHSGVAPGVAHSTASALAAMRGQRAPQAEAVSEAAWPPLLVIHGEADRVVSTSNARAAAQLWAEAAGARAGAVRSVRRGSRREMAVTDYKVGRRTVATLCEVRAMGHAWSGGDARHAFGDAQGPDASRMAWAFAARQFSAAQ